MAGWEVIDNFVVEWMLGKMSAVISLMISGLQSKTDGV